MGLKKGGGAGLADSNTFFFGSCSTMKYYEVLFEQMSLNFSRFEKNSPILASIYRQTNDRKAI
jgi:hypothetical protein